MKTLLRPYHILLLLVASASMLSLWKINKRSFYFHYFKVIEEVESRNSQALSRSIPHYFASVQRSFGQNVLPFLGFFLGFAALFSVRLCLTSGYQSEQVVTPFYQHFAYQSIPIRAP